MSISELFNRDLENGKLVTVNYICQKKNISKKDGLELLQQLVKLHEQKSNIVILKQIIGKIDNKTACRLVTSCDLEQEKKLFDSVDTISGWLVCKYILS